jgi:chromosome segregation ATPase
MSNFNEAADAIRRASKLLEGFKIAAEALDSIGSVDNAAKEAAAALDKAVKERDAVQAELASLILQAEGKRLDADNYVADAKARADAATQSALAEADHIVVDAVKAANEQSDKIILAAKSELKKVTDDVTGVQYQLREAKAVLVVVESDIVSKQKQLDSLNDALSKLKAKLA